MDAISAIARIVIFMLNGFLSGDMTTFAETTDITVVSEESVRSSGARRAPASTRNAGVVDESDAIDGAGRVGARPRSARDCDARNQTRELAKSVAWAIRKTIEVVQ